MRTVERRARRPLNKFLKRLFFIFKIIRYTVHGRGAKSPLGSNYGLKIRSKKLKLLFTKSLKKWSKKWSKTSSFLDGNPHLGLFLNSFFSETSKSRFSNLYCSVPSVTRTYTTREKSLKSGADTQRTNGTSSF